MKLVLDTNVLYSFFWKGSLIKKLLLSEHDLFSPEFSLKELSKHKSEIMEKTKLSSIEFEEFKRRLQKVVMFVPFSKYSNFLSKALSLLPEHPKDVDFFALALELNASILSKDKALKKQSEVRIFDESEFSDLLKTEE